MANPFQDALTESIDYLVKNRINKLDRDKTITATIVTCVNSLTQEYKVNYNNGYITAYAAEDANYRQNQMVYVLVPEGDFTKKLIIIGPASTTAGDNNITFVSSMLNDYNTIGDNVLEDPWGIYPLGLHSYLKEDYQLIYDKDVINGAEANMVSINIDKINNYIKEAESILIEATFQTRLPREHRIAKTGTYGIQFVLAFKDQAHEYDPENLSTVKYVSYILDTNNMTGNPMLYGNPTDQYNIYPIDAKNFLWIESILAFSKNFVAESDANKANLWGPDIFVKDIEFYGLRKIDTTNGDYRLKISTPRGATFKTISAEETLEVYGKVTYKNNDEISDTTSYYWFQKDDRVRVGSDNYHMYGGAGWKYLKDKGNNKHLITNGAENRAYENKYLCVAVYKEGLILKDYFTLYNEASKRDITIVSDIGSKFSFDRGRPNLTCLIDGKEENFEANNRPDSFYSFSWSKLNQDGSIVSFERTEDELQKELKNIYDKEDFNYSEVVNLKNQLFEVKDVVFNKNHLSYPVKNIDTVATFSCSVYLKDTEDGTPYFIGSATITLLNESAAEPNSYYILIVNGEQVFQYSESGISPASDCYVDPLEVKPLSCKFYDPAGLEVDPTTYSVKWVVPLESTMLIKPEGLIENPANHRVEWYPEETFPTRIEENFDYQALLNQVQCVVTYNGEEYSRYTNFLFVKVGDNGTNGTEFVAKIEEKDRLDNEPLTLYYNNKGQATLNNGGQVGTSTYGPQVLEFQLYNRNTLITDNLGQPKWSISGDSIYSKYIDVSDGSLKWDINKKIYADKSKTNLIIKGELRYESQSYYAFYPLITIDYKSEDIYSLPIIKTIHFNKQYLLKQVLYNADGRNPLFNKNQGVAFTVGNGNDPNYSVTLTAMGGVDDNSATAPFTLTPNRDENKGEKTVTLTSENGYFFCYIDVEKIYSGEFTNNRVHGIVRYNGNLLFEFDMPIHFTLNRYGLASLNAWDGNHIEINDDENYILAPQIGAGIKEDGNGFTGIVMGTASTYDQKDYRQDAMVGLLGYKNGEQSISLDARTGNAIFGLPEQMGTLQNRYSEGRIELIPGGTSKIGNWSIGSRFLYNTVTSSLSPSPFVTSGPTTERGMNVQGARVFIPQHGSGILLSADPPYLSIKGRDLTSSDLNTGDANNQLSVNDSIEVEIDPSKLSVFTVFRHHNVSGRWTRTPMVGISRTGEFYTNSLQYADTSFHLGAIGAFNTEAGDHKYLGSRLGYDDTFDSTKFNDNSSIIKFFVEYPGDDGTYPLHISGSSRRRDEYQRPIHLHGREIVLYSASASNGSAKTTSNKISINTSGAFVGDTSHSRLNINNNRSSKSEFIVEGDLTTTIGNTLTATVTDISTITLSKKATIGTADLTINTNTVDITAKVTTNNFTISNYGNIKLLRAGNSQKLELTSTQAVLSGGSSTLTLPNAISSPASLTHTGSINITAQGNANISAQGGSGKLELASKQAKLTGGGGYLNLADNFNLVALGAQEVKSGTTSVNGHEENAVIIGPRLKVANGIYGGGDLVIPGSSYLQGEVNLNEKGGNTTVKRNLTVNGTTELQGEAKLNTVGGNTTVGGALFVTRNIEAQLNIKSMTGDVFASNNESIKDNRKRADAAKEAADNAQRDITNHKNADNPHGITAKGIGAQPAGDYAPASHSHDGYHTVSAFNSWVEGVFWPQIELAKKMPASTPIA